MQDATKHPATFFEVAVYSRSKTGATSVVFICLCDILNNQFIREDRT
jgi:hypothetical protein